LALLACDGDILKYSFVPKGTGIDYLKAFKALRIDLETAFAKLLRGDTEHVWSLVREHCGQGTEVKGPPPYGNAKA
jgi:hypothetical protein